MNTGTHFWKIALLLLLSPLLTAMNCVPPSTIPLPVDDDACGGTQVTTLAGSTSGYADGTSTLAQFTHLSHMGRDDAHLYVIDHHYVRKITMATGEVTTLAGSGVFARVDGFGRDASFNEAHGLTVDGDNLYVTEPGAIRKVVIATGEVTTVAVNDTGEWSQLGGIAVVGSHLYVAELAANRITKVDIATGESTVLAGSIAVGDADGVGAAAQFHAPDGIVTDGSHLYVTNLNSIRKIVIATGEVTTLATSFNSPAGIAIDGAHLYVADFQGGSIRKVEIATGTVTTLAGSGEGFADGTATQAQFYGPYGIAAVGGGSDGVVLYVSDQNNNKIRKLVHVAGVCPPTGSHAIGGQVQGLSGTVVLQNNGGDDKTVTEDGVFVFSEPVAAGKPYEVTAATQPDGQICSVVNGSGTADANVSDIVVTCVSESAADDTDAPQTSASVAGGWYSGVQSVTLTCDDGEGSGCAATYYTIDGSTPTTDSDVYAEPIAVSADTTLKFFSVDAAGNEESVQTAVYRFDSAAPSSSASVAGGAYTSAQSVTLSCDDGSGSGCKAIYYTTDGGTPTTGSNVYGGAIDVSVDTTLKFFAVDVAGNQESVRTVIYQIDTDAPTVSATPGGSSVVSGTNVTLECSDSGSGCAAIYYTLNGSTPDTGSTVYAEPISITAAVTIKFLAVDNLGNPSAVQTETYTLASPVVALSAEGRNIVALKADGTVTAWSENTYGTMGHASGTAGDVCIEFTGCYNITPAAISGLSAVTAVETGPVHTIALKSDGTVWAWGRSHYGALGYDGASSSDPTYDGGFMGPEAYNATPQQVAGISNVVAIAAGADFSLALKSDGTVWSWGENFAGQLGDGSTTPHYAPAQVSTLTGVVAIAAGDLRAFAIKSDGTLWAWGDNGAGQLGIGNWDSKSAPVQVTALSDVVAVKVAPSFTLALKGDGTVWAWGDDFDGQLGNGTDAESTSPVQVSGLTGIDEIAIGFTSAFAMRSDGTAWAWGGNGYAQLGDGTTTNQTTPVAIAAVSDVAEIIAGDHVTGALLPNGTFWMWGNNDFGQLTHTPGTNGDADNFGWYGATAVQIGVAPQLAIAAPTDVLATGGGGAGAVAVSWTASTGAVSYNVYWSTSPEVHRLNGTKVAGATSGGDITGLTNGTRYYFVVTTVDSEGLESVPSAEVFAAP